MLIAQFVGSYVNILIAMLTRKKAFSIVKLKMACEKNMSTTYYIIMNVWLANEPICYFERTLNSEISFQHDEIHEFKLNKLFINSNLFATHSNFLVISVDRSSLPFILSPMFLFFLLLKAF